MADYCIKADALVGKIVKDPEGRDVGMIKDVYVDLTGGCTNWLLVDTGLLAGYLTVVPLAQADVGEAQVTVAYKYQKITGAPNVKEGREFNPVREGTLYDYYALPAPASVTSSVRGGEGEDLLPPHELKRAGSDQPQA